MKYCESIHQTKRWKTRVVMVGNVAVGGSNPIRTQSMTTCSTRDIEATIEQSIRLADAGCEIVRVTVQGMKEAESCEGIKNGLIRKGYNTPLVADIHFYPPAAMKVADFVDKVRVNPGNFVDKRASFKIIEYDDATYAEEILKIDEKFGPLVEKCKKLKRSMRIGTNHGSLSDRIMNRFGDTPQGMVESAVEFANVCRKHDYHDIIFSMKASNPQVMIQAYRLLVERMMLLGWDYPLHLGVTEAGQGEDGRIKSAMGMGSLLLDGIGDTIRVSLTEDPWYEIDPCNRLIQLASQAQGKGIEPFVERNRYIDRLEKRSVSLPQNISMHRDGTVVVSVTEEMLKQPDLFKDLNCEGTFGRPKLKGSTADMIALVKAPKDPQAIQIIKMLQEIGVGVLCPEKIAGGVQLLTLSQARAEKNAQKGARFSLSLAQKDPEPTAVLLTDHSLEALQTIEHLQPTLIIFQPIANPLHSARKVFEFLKEKDIKIPVILKFGYRLSSEDLVIHTAAEFGALFCDGLGEGIWIEADTSLDFLRNLSFSILQSARLRTFKTDFISCPSCGRTLFDLQDVTKRIRSRTAHLPGVKIAIMGCIVNGPGEMADADFGYVGSKPGKIDLYVGKQCVEKDIDFAAADDRLIALIKQHGRWQEVESAESAYL